MMAFEYKDNENKQYTRFTYPDDMNTIIRYIEERGKLNIDYMNLEKAWYAFSEIQDAQFLSPDNDLMNDFIEWLTDYTDEEIKRMTYYGYIGDIPYEPWKENEDYTE